MQRNRGFTLVELSIVLVVVGLLAGGILVGRDLIHAAKLRSVMSDFNAYNAAIGEFKVKYDELPGDMPNATAFWGAADDDDATCLTTEGTGTQTCNGNGNGKVWNGQAGNGRETYRFWQHLSNAGLISGSYSGIKALVDPGGVPGWNVPASKIGGASWSMEYINVDYSSLMGGIVAGLILALWGDQNASSHVLIFAGSSAGFASTGALTPNDTYNIDMKMDDGLPLSGLVSVPRLLLVDGSGESTGCTTLDVEDGLEGEELDDAIAAALAAGVEYKLDTKEEVCTVVFRLGV